MDVVNSKILNVMSLLTKLKSLSVLSKSWPLALNEHLFTTLSESCLCMMCFLMLLCPLLLSVFLVLLTLHLAMTHKVSIALRSTILWEQNFSSIMFSRAIEQR
jgi:hypothetical protein